MVMKLREGILNIMMISLKKSYPTRVNLLIGVPDLNAKGAMNAKNSQRKPDYTFAKSLRNLGHFAFKFLSPLRDGAVT
jgi:hypothetical protein